MHVEISSLEDRAQLHRALGDSSRLAIVDALAIADRTVGELQEHTGLTSNLLAFHLRVLEGAGVIHRRPSDGDRRRRYVRLDHTALDALRMAPAAPPCRSPLFVCTHNSARSQFAAALWRQATGRNAASAGSQPASVVHPLAVKIAKRHGVDLSGARPRGYADVRRKPDLVVSVCDRALESGIPFEAPRLHWSVPDPVTGDETTFEAAFDDIAKRVGRLAVVAA